MASRLAPTVQNDPPKGVSFTVDGEFVGTMPVEGGTPHGQIALRGWEGHVRCRRLVVWAMPQEENSAVTDLLAR